MGLPGEAYTAGAEALKHMNNVYQFWAYMFTVAVGLLAVYIIYVARNSKKVIELVKDNEHKETAIRKAERDKQIDDLKNDLVKTDTALAESVRSVSEKLENHINLDKVNDDKIQSRIDKMDDKLRNIETGMIMKQEFSIFTQKVSGDFSGLNTRVSDVREAVIKLSAVIEERMKYEHKQ